MRHLILSFLVLYHSATDVFAGDTRSNGGDVVSCRPDPEQKFSGNYFLDFLVEASKDPQGVAALASETDDVSLLFMSKGLWELGSEVSDFEDTASAQINLRPNHSAKYIWQEAALGLNNLRDENLVGPLPTSCYETDTDGKFVKLTQAVIRSEMTGTRGIVYNYSSKALASIASVPYQTDFMLVHEWLWRHADNADVVRSLNWYLHSKAAQNLPADQFLDGLANRGFIISGKNRPWINGQALAYSNEITIRLTGTLEPNGQPAFSIPALVALDTQKPSLKITSPNGLTFTLGFYDEANTVYLCERKLECVVPLTSISAYPARFFVERAFMGDPLWDIKRFTVFR